MVKIYAFLWKIHWYIFLKNDEHQFSIVEEKLKGVVYNEHIASKKWKKFFENEYYDPYDIVEADLDVSQYESFKRAQKGRSHLLNNSDVLQFQKRKEYSGY